ncbi:MAG TPA: hypothetical protein VMS64_05695 [Candidatus Methylomirabilis sp.]|nr:hypothetical protein [Candidatus Methylomirabilis sp.]
MGKKTVAELLVDTLVSRDVSRIYGVAGDSLNGITDSIRRQDHLRMTALLGFSSGYHAMMACDVLLIIGADFPYRQFFPEDTTTVQIDVRGEQFGRRTKVDRGLVGDAKATLRALLPRLAPHEDERHLKTAREHYVRERKSLDELATLGSVGPAAILNTSPG